MFIINIGAGQPTSTFHVSFFLSLFVACFIAIRKGNECTVNCKPHSLLTHLFLAFILCISYFILIIILPKFCHSLSEIQIFLCVLKLKETRKSRVYQKSLKNNKNECKQPCKANRPLSNNNKCFSEFEC